MQGMKTGGVCTVKAHPVVAYSYIKDYTELTSLSATSPERF
jgi:hypothetical protein